MLLYCPQCARTYALRSAVEGWELCCAACGSVLAAGSPPGELRLSLAGILRLRWREKDPFLGRAIAGVRLARRLTVYPTRIVYRGAHKGLRAQVRVEVFPAAFVDQNMDYIQRLFARAAATNETRSTYVVTVLDLGRRRDCCFVVTERQPSNLRALLDREGGLSVRRALVFADNVLSGLSAVEAVGRAHGNATPDGVLLSYDGSAKLDHLGQVQRPEDLRRLVITPGGNVTGPAFYAAPEAIGAGGSGQGSEDRADIRSDIYSLGITMYEMLGGRPPYEAATAEQVLRKHAQEPTPDLSLAAPAVPAELSRFVARLMAKDRAERPQTPQQALAELRDCAVSLSRRGRIEPVSAAASGPERKRAAARSATLWSIAALVLVALAIIPVVWMYRQRQHASAAAEQTQPGAPQKVLVVLGPARPALKDELTPDEVLAVRTLIAQALALYPDLSVADESHSQDAEKTGMVAPESLEKAGVSHVLVAAYAAGFGRRNWTLRFITPAKKPWSASVECAVEAEGRGSLAPLESAVNELLCKAAVQMKLGAVPALPSSADPKVWAPATGADAKAWALIGRALLAEREDRWDEALACARQAHASAPDAASFALLSAFYEAVESVRKTGRFPDASPDAGTSSGSGGAGLVAVPPEMAAIRRVLKATGEGDPAAVERSFADYLQQFPRSARGYFLLGLWRLHGERSEETAVVAFRHAFELDPRYTPPAHACVELLARRSPAEVEAFVKDAAARIEDKDAVRRIEEFAHQLASARYAPRASP